jgi:uncharacterized membrane protein YfcA
VRLQHRLSSRFLTRLFAGFLVVIAALLVIE